MATPLQSTQTRPPRHGLRRRLPSSEKVLAVVMVGFGTVLAMARQPGVHSWRTIWQEDGAIFLNHAWKDPFLDTLGQVYNSYLHTVPRLLAGVVALFPLDRAALGLTLSACLVISALGLYIYYASAAIYTSPWSRFLLAAMIVLLPAGGYETNAAISDLHWYFLYAAFWALLANPKDRRGIVIGSLVCLGAVLSDPLTGLIMPLVIQRAWSAWRAGERMRLVMPILFTAGLALQVVLGSVSAPTGRDAQSHFADLPGIYALRVAGSTLVGDQWLGTFWLPLGYAFAYGALAIVLGLVLYAFLKARGERRWFVLGSFVFSVLILCVPLMLRGTQFFLDRSIYSLNGSRYTVVPVMFLMGILVLLLDQRDRRLSPTAWRHVQMAGGAFLAGLIVTSFSVVTVRSAGPDWPGQVMKARRQCAEMAKGAPLPDLNALPPAPGDPPTPPTELRIPVSPNIPDSSQPFAVTLSCDKDLR